MKEIRRQKRNENLKIQLSKYQEIKYKQEQDKVK